MVAIVLNTNLFCVLQNFILFLKIKTFPLVLKVAFTDIEVLLTPAKSVKMVVISVICIPVTSSLNETFVMIGIIYNLK
ncbi:hypothetical protein HMF3257_17180 [Spirosoma telluris]|uniref:Uncharacterized protein n=1 Tax=Spirosoma telluris TaxID=2183553 RepID=A0A327NN60_9BACT|nr:hypothetical protein HMF3257_17180 [Spirosoma telluris]